MLGVWAFALDVFIKIKYLNKVTIILSLFLGLILLIVTQILSILLNLRLIHKSKIIEE